MRAFWKQFIVEFKLRMREPEAVFWSFIFPIVMVIVLGVLFNNKEKQSLVILVGVDKALLTDSNHGEFFKELSQITNIKVISIDKTQVEQDFKNENYHIWLDLRKQESTTQILLKYSNIAEKEFEIEEKVFDALLHRLNQQFLSATAVVLPFDMKTEKVIIKGKTGRELSYVDWLLPGVVGLNLFTSCTFGIGMTVVQDKKNGKYKKVATTPLPSWQFILTTSLQRMFLLYIEAFVVLLTGYFAFHIQPVGSLIDFFCLLTVSIFAYMLFGFSIASISKTLEKAVAISNVTFIFAMLLSGAYFSNAGLPPYLKTIANLLPTTLCVEAMRGIYSYGNSLIDFIPNIIGLLIWWVICLLFSVRFFRWMND